MGAVRVPAALMERLGEPASVALVEMQEANNRACVDEVMTQVAERFERRLVEETSKLRVEMAQLRGDLRQEIAQLGGNLRNEMAQLGGNLRSEMTVHRFELLKWMFVFWVGQLVSVVGIVALLLRTMSPR